MTTQAPSIEQIRGAWNGIADGFDEFVTPETMVLGKEVVPAMIERLNARARAEGLSTVRGRTMDGHALDLDDDVFDVAASMNGVSWFPDMARGVAELVRVTRPGGRVVIVAFGPIDKVEFIVFCTSAVQAAVPDVTPLPTDPPPLPFQAADPGVLRARLVDAGLRDIRIDTITWETAFDSVQHLWQVFTASNPIGAQMAARLGDEQRAEVTQVLEGMLRERSAGAPGQCSAPRSMSESEPCDEPRPDKEETRHDIDIDGTGA